MSFLLDGVFTWWMTQTRCVDGGANAFTPACVSQPQQENWPVYYRKADWGSNGVPYYQISDAVIRANGDILKTFSYTPFWAFSNANGDGADWYRQNGNSVYAYATQNAASPVQYFNGPECGGDGWLFARADIQAGALTNYVGRISIGSWFGQCPPMIQYLTRYGYFVAQFPVRFNSGEPVNYRQEVLVSEHFGDSPDATASQAMERFVFTPYLGNIQWQSWIRNHPPTLTDLDQRCPAITWEGGSTLNPPDNAGGNWNLNDCRTWTNLQTGFSGGFTIEALRWPWP